MTILSLSDGIQTVCSLCNRVLGGSKVCLTLYFQSASTRETIRTATLRQVIKYAPLLITSAAWLSLQNYIIALLDLLLRPAWAAINSSSPTVRRGRLDLPARPTVLCKNGRVPQNGLSRDSFYDWIRHYADLLRAWLTRRGRELSCMQCIGQAQAVTKTPFLHMRSTWALLALSMQQQHEQTQITWLPHDHGRNICCRHRDEMSFCCASGPSLPASYTDIHRRRRLGIKEPIYYNLGDSNNHFPGSW